jgi:uncharacterized membrane protein
MKFRPIAISLLAFIGMIDALYLSLKRNAGPIPCHITKGCTDVLTSKYSAVLGVPLSWFGLVFYLTVFSLTVFTLFGDGDRKEPAATSKIAFYLSGLALVISALLVGIQAFILRAYCEYCLLSAVLVFSIFLLSPHPGSRHTLPE